MDCTVISAELIPYYFATSTDAQREATDAHLLTCTDCLRRYLGVKHHIERAANVGAKGAEKPSERARLRLRAEVTATFRPTARARVRTWFSRPIPLYQGLAAALVAVVLAALGPSLAHGTPPDVASSGQYVDTSRRTPENLTVY